MRLLLATALISISLLPGLASGHSQSPTDQVQWTFVDASTTPLHHGATTSLRVDARLKEGWHVYGSTQLEGGPIALKASLDENPVAAPNGKINGSEALKLHDPAFNLETTVYKSDFFLTFPVRLKSDAPSGAGSVPVSIRYQSCNDRTCLPPKTVHLRIPVSVAATR